ncbi:MAG: relaxase/mobilization nuclease domain-containing protein [Methylococcaceae bacterium]
MILKASQRGNARELAKHLLNGHDNEHVEVYSINGFMADNIHGALQEAHALSLGTKCQQPLFSVSLSPPKDEIVSTQIFEEAITSIAEKMGLENQPHIIVFHEKNGRRHCHAVFSRIDTKTMTAINLPYFKNKLMEVSKELYLKHNWKLPQGHIDRQMRNPLNFTREQWQQAKRLNDDPKVLKQTLKECWAISDSKKAFSGALEQHGFYLAKGERRGFVAVDWRGEVYSLSRWLDVKTKVLKAQLGEPENLPSVSSVKANLDQKLAQRIHTFTNEIKQQHGRCFSPILAQKDKMIKRHQETRNILAEKQSKRQEQEKKKRQARFSKGFRGIWDRFTGKHSQAKKQNEIEAYQSYLRDKVEKDTFIFRQLEERSALQNRLDELKTHQQEDISKLKEALFSKLPEEKMASLRQELDRSSPKNDYNNELSM